MTFSCNNIYKKYQNNLVINKFSYKFDSGLYLLTGINGIGKSTLLKIIAKVIKPTNYNFVIDNVKTAYLCEKIELLNCKVYPFLKAVSKINKIKLDIKNELIKWNVPNKNIYNLSKGNKQKIAIIMMMLTDAEIYLFDEPTNALDSSGIILFLDFIKRLIEKKKIVIISTHDQDYFKKFEYEEISLSCLG